MNLSVNKYLAGLIVSLWSLLLLGIAFPDVLLHPGKVMLALGGDGSKNYFTFLYHSLYGKGIWFEGMNYPYGEHLFYPDAQPLFTLLFLAAKNHISLTVNDALALMHGGICLSFFLAVIFNYKILRVFKAPFLWSLILAACITYMSPQLLRLYGHYSLAYPSFTAMLLYFTLQFHYGRQIRYAVYILLLGLVMYLIHPYFPAFCVFWIGAYSLSTLLVRGKEGLKKVALSLLPLWIAVAALMLLVTIFMSVTDPVKDRPGFPYGATAYCATGQELVTSSYSPVWQLLQHMHLAGSLANGGEGFGYTGICSLLVLLSCLILLLRRKRYPELSAIRHTISPEWWWMSLFFLVLAMGVPFVWDMEWLLHYLGPFRQFRSLGRFIFLYYQLVTMLTCVLLLHWYSVCKDRRKGALLLTLPLLLWSVETYGYICGMRQISLEAPQKYQEFFAAKEQSWEAFLKENGTRVKDFQAVLLLPFVHTGSDKWSVGNSKEAGMYHGFKVSLATALPLIDVQMPRHSWSQTAMQVRIAGGPFTRHTYCAMIGHKPVLVVVAAGEELTPDEQFITEHARFLGEKEGCKIYFLLPEQLVQASEDACNDARKLASSLSGQDTVIGVTDPNIISEHYDSNADTIAVFGKGCLRAIRNRSTLDTILLEREIKPVDENRLYEISSWVLMSTADFRTPVLNLSLLDESGNEIYRRDAMGKESVDNHGMWFRINLYFKMPGNAKKLVWRLYDQKEGSYLAFDECMLRPVSDTVLHRFPGGGLMVNNFYLKPVP